MRAARAGLTVAVLAAALAVARAQSVQRPPVTLPGTRTPPPPIVAVLIGTVIDAMTDRPVPRAVVRLRGQSISVSRLVDQHGRFFFRDLPPGEFDLTAEKPPFFSGAFGRLRAGGDSLPVVLAGGEWLVNLRIPLFRPSVLAGEIVDESGEPLIGIRVTALRREYVAGRWQLSTSSAGFTDDHGRYRLGDLRPGEYVVSVPSVAASVPIDTSAAGDAGDAADNLAHVLRTKDLSGLPAPDMPGVVFDPARAFALLAGRSATPPPREANVTYAYPNTYYPGGNIASLGIPIAVAPGEARANVNLQLRAAPTASIFGRVVGPDGPVADQLLRLFPADDVDPGPGNETAVTVTSRAGSFGFLDVPVGRYRISARSVAALRQDVTLSVAAGRWGEREISLASDDLTDVTVTMREGLTIAGRVQFSSRTGRVPSGTNAVLVLLEPAEGGNVVPAIARMQDGEFHFDGLAGGRYLVRVIDAPRGWMLGSAMVNRVDVSETPLEIGNGGDPPIVVVTLTDQPVVVQGTVRDPRGNNAPQATVVAFPVEFKWLADYGRSPRRLAASRASLYGVYEIAGLPAGDYWFAAIEERASDNWQDPRVLERLATSTATRVTIRDGDLRTIDLRLPGARR